MYVCVCDLVVVRSVCRVKPPFAPSSAPAHTTCPERVKAAAGWIEDSPTGHSLWYLGAASALGGLAACVYACARPCWPRWWVGARARSSPHPIQSRRSGACLLCSARLPPRARWGGVPLLETEQPAAGMGPKKQEQWSKLESNQPLGSKESGKNKPANTPPKKDKRHRRESIDKARKQPTGGRTTCRGEADCALGSRPLSGATVDTTGKTDARRPPVSMLNFSSNRRSENFCGGPSPHNTMPRRTPLLLCLARRAP